MRRLFPKAGPRPVDTDTVFEINPIAAHAPKVNRALSLLTTCIVYGGLAAGTVALGHAKLAEARPGPATTGGCIQDVLLRDPVQALPERPPAPAVPEFKGFRPADWQKPVDMNAVPDTTPPELPTVNRFNDGKYNEAMPIGDPSLNPKGPVGGTEQAAPVGATAAQVIEVSVTSMRILHQAPVNYPMIARYAKIQGPVELLLTVDGTGRPAEVAVLSGPPQLHAEAMRCAREWRFEPARVDGHPVSARFRLTLNFRLM